MSKGIYVFKNEVNYGPNGEYLHCTYIIGVTEDIHMPIDDEDYAKYRNEGAFVFPANFWIRRRFRKLIAMLNEVGCPTDEEYDNDNRTRLIQNAYEFEWLQDMIWECANCGRDELAPFKN